MRKTTSEIISSTESAIRASFDVHTAKAVLLEVPPEPRAGRTPGEVVVDMMKAAATPSPEVSADHWATAFRADVTKHTSTISALAQEGADLMSVVRFLRGAGEMNGTVPMELRSAAVALKESSDATLPLSVARRIELGIAPTIAEVQRLRAYVARCESAAEVTIHKKLAAFFEKCGPRYGGLYQKHTSAMIEARAKNNAIRVKPGFDRRREILEDEQ